MGDVEQPKLTDKQKMFISEYLVNGFNATQAAISAGYSEDTAYSIGHENLNKPEIRQAINAEINRTLDNNREELKRIVLDEYRKIATSDIKKILQYDQDGVVITPSDDVDTSVISSVEIEQDIVSSKSNSEIAVSNKKIKFKLHDKIKALEGLAKYLTLFSDGIDIPEGTEITIKRIKADANS